jgi:hypothetical protein
MLKAYGYYSNCILHILNIGWWRIYEGSINKSDRFETLKYFDVLDIRDNKFTVDMNHAI